MDDFIELLVSVFFEGNDKLLSNKNIPNGFKFAFIFLTVFFLLGSIFLGVLFIPNCFFLGLFFLVMGILLLIFSTYKILQWRNTEKNDLKEQINKIRK